MKVIGINAGPRKNFNTAELLENALKGAESQGAQTELINLYDYTFKGCVSCFACKIKNSRTKGLCAYRDELTPILQKALNADALIIGTPVYFDSPTAYFHAFFERFAFPLNPYLENKETGERLRVLESIKPVGLIFDMNVPESRADEKDYPVILGVNEMYLNRIVGYSESVYVYDTFQFRDYGNYECNLYDVQHKLNVKQEQFPRDCANAYNLGVKISAKAATGKF